MGVKLYHYTSFEGKTGIEKDKKIRMSARSSIRDDAVYGSGVYFTSLGPENSTEDILGNNYDGMSIPEWKKKQTEYYFVFDEDDLDGVEEVGGKKRDIWLLRDKDAPCTQKALKRRI